MNSFGISKSLEKRIRKRDKFCIYCGVMMTRKIDIPSEKKHIASWEHIINDIPITKKDNIALCCCSCNSSKGVKNIFKWFESDYCKRNNININTVSKVIRKHIIAWKDYYEKIQ